MIRWYPMARAKSRLAGFPVVYDLTKISYLVGVFPRYDPVVRRIETITRELREKRFAVRVAAELNFEVPHSRARNLVARWTEFTGNLIRNANDLSSPDWTLGFATVARSPERDPVGLLDAWRVTDADAAHGGTIIHSTVDGGYAGRLSYFFRADASHPTGATLNGLDANFQADAFWRHGSVIYDAGTGPYANWAVVLSVFSTADVFSTGTVDLYAPDVRAIVTMPGTDEEILADLKNKLASDDWDVEVSLDGGLTWRTVLLDSHEKLRMEDKWVGYRENFAFTCAKVIRDVPATRDGVW